MGNAEKRECANQNRTYSEMFVFNLCGFAHRIDKEREVIILLLWNVIAMNKLVGKEIEHENLWRAYLR